MCRDSQRKEITKILLQIGFRTNKNRKTPSKRWINGLREKEVRENHRLIQYEEDKRRFSTDK